MKNEIHAPIYTPASQEPKATSHFDPTGHERLSEQKRYDTLLAPYSKEQLISDVKNVLPGIETGYKIGEVDLAFPSGAISVIAAPTGHGKTTALINFSLGVLDKNPDKNVYFITYEEDRRSITLSFMNTFIGEPLNAGSNNKKLIEDYLRSGITTYVTESKTELLKVCPSSFFNMYINNGRLKVLYPDMLAEDLVEFVKHIKKTDPNLGLISIDYFQLLRSRGKHRSRQEELKNICLSLKDLAIDIGAPIVVAAQFNRQVVSERDLSPVNIADAADIERITSLLIGIYNRNYDQMTKDGNRDRSGNLVPKESSLYAEILKGRGIGNGHFSVMPFNGNTGVISNKESSQIIDIIKD